MADLDDFFAKKDRKKTKTKKFATPDELVKKLEDTTKRNEVVKPRKEPQSTQQPSDGGVENESREQLHAPEVCVPKFVPINFIVDAHVYHYVCFMVMIICKVVSDTFMHICIMRCVCVSV